MNIFEHEQKAWELYLKHAEECAQKLGIHLDEYERGQIGSDWAECQQIKILDTGHVKVKWEARCWWADCPTPWNHSYYCIVALPDWKFPHEAFNN